MYFLESFHFLSSTRWFESHSNFAKVPQMTPCLRIKRPTVIKIHKSDFTFDPKSTLHQISKYKNHSKWEYQFNGHHFQIPMPKVLVLTLMIFTEWIKKGPLGNNAQFCLFTRIYAFLTKFQKWNTSIICFLNFWWHFEYHKVLYVL